MDAILTPLKQIFGMKLRKFFHQIVILGLVVSSALMMWKGLSIFTNTESPIVVVLTGSMEPSFKRGDLLFLTWDYTPPKSGDIVVYKVPNYEIPIVHRVIATQLLENGDYNCLTKGDANEVNDRGLYPNKWLWLNKQHLHGRIKGFMPYIGILTILLNDYPMLKWVILGIMGILVLTAADPEA